MHSECIVNALQMRFSHTGNLRTHLKLSHKLDLVAVKKGTNSSEHVRNAISKSSNAFIMHC